MLLLPLTLGFAWTPATKFITRLILALIMKEVIPEVTTPSPMTASTSTVAPKLSNLIPGIYDYESSVNFDNYLAALGVNYVLRKLAGLAYPVVTIMPCQTNDCDWTIRTDTVFRSHEVSFKLNEKKIDTTMDNRKVEFVVHQPKSNQLVEIQKSLATQISTSITRNFEKNQMSVELLVNGVAAKSYFKRREETFFKDDNFAFSTRKQK